jgi:hypothetical protein
MSIDKEDSRLFSAERVMGSDELNADPLNKADTLIELWWCCFCGSYFRVYYKLEKIVSLVEHAQNKPVESDTASGAVRDGVRE